MRRGEWPPFVLRNFPRERGCPRLPLFPPVPPHPSPLPRGGEGMALARASPAVASLPRPFVVCLGFAKGTGDHEGRPYGLNW